MQVNLRIPTKFFSFKLAHCILSHFLNTMWHFRISQAANIGGDFIIDMIEVTLL